MKHNWKFNKTLKQIHFVRMQKLLLILIPLLLLVCGLLIFFKLNAVQNSPAGKIAYQIEIKASTDQTSDLKTQMMFDLIVKTKLANLGQLMDNYSNSQQQNPQDFDLPVGSDFLAGVWSRSINNYLENGNNGYYWLLYSPDNPLCDNSSDDWCSKGIRDIKLGAEYHFVWQYQIPPTVKV